MQSDGEALQEYATLGEELLHLNRARLLIFGVAVAAVGALLVITFLIGSVNQDALAPRLILIYLAHAVVNVALLLTHRRTHQMDFTAGYLRTFVEPRIRRARRDRGPETAASGRRGRLPLQSSRALGACYALLISAIVAAGIANGLYQTMWAIGLPVWALTGVFSANWLFMSEQVGPPTDPVIVPDER